MDDLVQTPPINGTREGRKPAIQVIVLGSGGGPSEDNVTGLLVRSTSSGWAKGSLLAVDAGTHMAAITKILEQQLPLVYPGQERADSNGSIIQQQMSPRQVDMDDASSPISPQAETRLPLEPTVLTSGPFAGLPLPHVSARANAAHIVRSHVSTYLITHPHLDHLSGFAINTAAFHATSRPKRVAALPSTVNAIKQHIFNDVIWPNLTDEDGGVGFVTFQRLKEGGDIMVGEGEGRGYIEVCEGLGAKGFRISHGKCMRPSNYDENPRGSLGNIADVPNGYGEGRRYTESRHMSLSHLSLPRSPGPSSFNSPSAAQQNVVWPGDMGSTVDSTAYFIRDIATSREVLIFGDVEPDSVSLAPRLGRVWAEAAPKIAQGILTGIFIECSYDDSQADAVLFGHLAPRHLVAELGLLAEMVREEKVLRASEKAMRKRKRDRNANGTSVSFPGSVGTGTGSGTVDEIMREGKRNRSLAGRAAASLQLRRASAPFESSDMGTQTPTLPGSPDHGPLVDKSGLAQVTPTPLRIPALDLDYAKPRSAGGGSDKRVGLPPEYHPQTTLLDGDVDAPLKGVRVVIIHVKDTLRDGPHISERILEQVRAHAQVMEERGEKLGCEWSVSSSGTDYWF